jgi:hypothetical protein
MHGSNLGSSCLNLLNAGIIGINYHGLAYLYYILKFLKIKETRAYKEDPK